MSYPEAIEKLKKEPRVMLTQGQMDAMVGKTIASIGHPAGLGYRLSIHFTDFTSIEFEAV